MTSGADQSGVNSDARDDTARSGAVNARKPKVSALVPCYNAEKFLQRTLDCLALQTWPNLEILIADDCSTDKTLEIVQAFAHENANVRILNRTQNLGWLKNTNDLMKNATGEFLFFAFHDDVVAPTYAEELATALINNRRAILAFSDMEVIDIHEQAKICTFKRITGKTTSLFRGCLMALAPKMEWWVPNRGVFRATAFDQIGGIKPNTEGEYSADWTWLLHMALLGEFIRIPRILCRKYYQKDSLSKTWPHNPKQRAALMQAGIREVENSPVTPAIKRLLKTVIRFTGLRAQIRIRTRLKQAFSVSQ